MQLGVVVAAWDSADSSVVLDHIFQGLLPKAVLFEADSPPDRVAQVFNGLLTPGFVLGGGFFEPLELRPHHFYFLLKFLLLVDLGLT